MNNESNCNKEYLISQPENKFRAKKLQIKAKNINNNMFFAKLKLKIVIPRSA
jgi:beta-lactamase regulating signal transducer with metallopeptidase domain